VGVSGGYGDSGGLDYLGGMVIVRYLAPKSIQGHMDFRGRVYPERRLALRVSQAHKPHLCRKCQTTIDIGELHCYLAVVPFGGRVIGVRECAGCSGIEEN